MRFFYDCEFLENGETIDLISIGMVAEDGRELYLVDERVGATIVGGRVENTLYRRICNHKWLMGNVVPHLPLKPGPADPGFWDDGGSYPGFRLDIGSNTVVPRRYIRNAVRDFIAAAGPDRDQHELWAYYGAYDHVALCQLFGRMVNLPDCVPMFTHELMQLPHVEEAKQLVTQEDEHHALADARWNRAVWLGAHSIAELRRDHG